MHIDPKLILVPVALEPDDDFGLAKDAVLAACDVAEKFGSRLVIAHLVTVVTPSASASIDPSGKMFQSLQLILQARKKRGAQMLVELQQLAMARKVEAEHTLIEAVGMLGEEICEAASSLGADLIVVGSHGRKGLKRLLLGSVAERVVHLAKMPVLLLHH